MTECRLVEEMVHVAEVPLSGLAQALLDGNNLGCIEADVPALQELGTDFEFISARFDVLIDDRGRAVEFNPSTLDRPREHILPVVEYVQPITALDRINVDVAAETVPEF